EGDAVEGLGALGVVVHAQHADEAAADEVVEVVADAEDVVVTTGDDATAADAAADRPADGVGVIIRDADAEEEADTLAVRHAVAEGDGGVALVHDAQVLPGVGVEGPGVVVARDLEAAAGAGRIDDVGTELEEVGITHVETARGDA